MDVGNPSDLQSEQPQGSAEADFKAVRLGSLLKKSWPGV
jgi:hypothetical protein